MKVTDLDYESPWRPNYEARAVSVWVLSAVVGIGVNQLSPMPPEPVYWLVVIASVMASFRVPQAYHLYRLQKHLAGRPLTFIKLDALWKTVRKRKNSNQVWLGRGFVWEQKHAQRVHEIKKRSLSDTVKNDAHRLTMDDELGQRWIHGVEPNEEDIVQSLVHANGMTFIVGTTGSGKTRLFDLLISQAIARNEPVIIIDPKGDRELRDNARRACESLGRGNLFANFHPSLPDESIRLDLMSDYGRVTELASRIAALIPSEAGADPFKSFGWQAVNNICQALVIAEESPTLVTLKRFLEGGAASIVWRALSAHIKRSIVGNPLTGLPCGDSLVDNVLATAKGTDSHAKAKALTVFYRESLPEEFKTSELDGIVTMFEHDKTHYSKMVTNLLPVMNMLTSGPLAKLLSPGKDDLDTREVITPTAAIDNGRVLYVGLDSLSDAIVGSAIGSILLSACVATAGQRYNSGDMEKHVNIFIDEAAEVINAPTIQLLNKGRGAKMRMYVASQTTADLEVRLGGEAQALQVLGNMNNLISLRVIDQKTQEYVALNLPKTTIKTVMRTQGLSSASDSPLMFSASTGERLMEEEGDLFPPQLLGMLPNLEYIAKLSGGTVIKGRLPILQGDAK